MRLELKKVKDYSNGVSLFKTRRGVKWFSWEDEELEEILYISEGMVEEFDPEQIEPGYITPMSKVRVLVLDVMKEDPKEFGRVPERSIGYEVNGNCAGGC